MKEEIKKKWVKALKSKKYKQGKGKLCSGDYYCCLGVLCDIHRKTVTKKASDKVWKNDCYHNSPYYLPKAVMTWAGLESSNPDLQCGGTCAYLNDTGANFDKIADLINKNL